MTFNELLVECGDFGWYQKFLTFGYLPHTLLMIACVYWTQVFMLLIPPHRCKISLEDNEWNTRVNDSHHQGISDCHSYNASEAGSCLYGVVYDFSENFPTFASQNNWVCQSSWKMYAVQSYYWIGSIFGMLLAGAISDKFGRKRAYQLCVLMTLVSDIITLFCPDQISFTVARACSAVGSGSVSTIAFVLVMEYTGHSVRRINLFIYSFTFSIGSALMPWIAFVVRSWKSLLIISWVPLMTGIILSFFVPESASWLLTQGRIDETVQLIHRMARINGKNLDRGYILEKLLEEKNNGKSNKVKCTTSTVCDTQDVKDETAKPKEMSFISAILAVLKSPNLRKRLISFSVIWIVGCSCYYGSNLEANNLPFSMYIAYSLGALIEIPGTTFYMLTLDKFGRRWSGASFYIVGGLLGILSAKLSYKPLVVVCALVMRTCYSCAFDISFTFSNESFPTLVRGRAISLFRTVGGIGNAMAPFIVKLSEQDPLLPLVVFGIMSAIAGIFIIFNPETTNQDLPHTIEEGEYFGKDQLFWFCPFNQVSIIENSDYETKGFGNESSENKRNSQGTSTDCKY